MHERLPILLCFDVEPDDKLIVGEADWAGVTSLVNLLTEYRPRFEEATGTTCRFSWFLRMDPQVRELTGRSDWVATAFDRELELIEHAEDDIGLHVHPWRRAAQGWISDFGDPTWVDQCVCSSFEAYQRIFEKSCRSFRFGDRWMDHRTMRLLADLGIYYDLTLEPEQKGFPVYPEIQHLFIGERPDFTGVPRQVYQPSLIDYRRPGWWGMGLTEFPISTAPEGTLYLSSDATCTCANIDRLIADPTTTHIALPARTDVAIRPDLRKNLVGILEHLVTHPQRHWLHFATAAEVSMAGIIGEQRFSGEVCA
jgi:hypothetical protein